MRALIYLIFFTGWFNQLHAQATKIMPDVFWVWPVQDVSGKTLACVSLSEIFDYDAEQDSLYLPDLSAYTSDTAAEVQFIPLGEPYRSRFLKGCGIKQSDSLFAYSYLHQRLQSFSVKHCGVAAVLNPYGGFLPLNAEDYMFCLTLETSAFQGFEFNFTHTFVSVGSKNPFYSGSVKNVVWQNSSEAEIPIQLKYTIDSSYSGPVRLYSVNRYEQDGYQFFIQNFEEDIMSDSEIRVKILSVIGKKSGELICQHILYTGESASFAGPEEQYAGILFNNLPPVIFGLQYESFGCPAIYFLDKQLEPLIIKCDNRH
jgi:hypothetical protein